MAENERDAKDRQLEHNRTDSTEPLTADTGVRVEDVDNPLCAGPRGPTLEAPNRGRSSSALSQANSATGGITGGQIALLAAGGRRAVEGTPWPAGSRTGRRPHAPWRVWS